MRLQQFLHGIFWHDDVGCTCLWVFRWTSSKLFLMQLTSRLLPPSLHQRVLNTACTLARAQPSRTLNCGPAMFLRALSSAPLVATNNPSSKSRNDSRAEANVNDDSNTDKARLLHVCNRDRLLCVSSRHVHACVGFTCSFI